jgi:hypothetical protein
MQRYRFSCGTSSNACTFRQYTFTELFATGTGGLGLLGWSRKRKAQAVA